MLRLFCALLMVAMTSIQGSASRAISKVRNDYYAALDASLPDPAEIPADNLVKAEVRRLAEGTNRIHKGYAVARPPAVPAGYDYRRDPPLGHSAIDDLFEARRDHAAGVGAEHPGDTYDRESGHPAFAHHPPGEARAEPRPHVFGAAAPPIGSAALGGAKSAQ